MVEVAGLPVVQVKLDVSRQVTISLFAGTYEKVGPPDPTICPLTLHSYDGLFPPFTGVAVKVTVVWAQTGFCEADIDTPTGNGAFTTIVITLDVYGLLITQGELEVRVQLMTSLFTGT